MISALSGILNKIKDMTPRLQEVESTGDPDKKSGGFADFFFHPTKSKELQPHEILPLPENGQSAASVPGGFASIGLLALASLGEHRVEEKLLTEMDRGDDHDDDYDEDFSADGVFIPSLAEVPVKFFQNGGGPEAASSQPLHSPETDSFVENEADEPLPGFRNDRLSAVYYEEAIIEDRDPPIAEVTTESVEHSPVRPDSPSHSPDRQPERTDGLRPNLIPAPRQLDRTDGIPAAHGRTTDETSSVAGVLIDIRSGGVFSEIKAGSPVPLTAAEPSPTEELSDREPAEPRNAPRATLEPVAAETEKTYGEDKISSLEKPAVAAPSQPESRNLERMPVTVGPAESPNASSPRFAGNEPPQVQALQNGWSGGFDGMVRHTQLSEETAVFEAPAAQPAPPAPAAPEREERIRTTADVAAPAVLVQKDPDIAAGEAAYGDGELSPVPESPVWRLHRSRFYPLTTGEGRSQLRDWDKDDAQNTESGVPAAQNEKSSAAQPDVRGRGVTLLPDINMSPGQRTIGSPENRGGMKEPLPAYDSRAIDPAAGSGGQKSSYEAVSPDRDASAVIRAESGSERFPGSVSESEPLKVGFAGEPPSAKEEPLLRESVKETKNTGIGKEAQVSSFHSEAAERETTESFSTRYHGNYAKGFEGALQSHQDLNLTADRLLKGIPLRAGSSAAVEEGLLHAVRFIRSEGRPAADIIIDPPALGRMEIELTSTAKGIEASIKVGSEQIRQIVQENITLLRNNLEQQGVHLGEFIVDVRDDPGENSERRFSPRDGRRRIGRRLEPAINPDGEAVLFRLDLERGILSLLA